MIRVANSSEFKKLIDSLSSDVVDAHIHWRLHLDLYEALQNHPIVRHQSSTFWHLTLKAHVETAIEHLCRAFDQEQSALHLLSWLTTIRDNLHLFDTEEFKQRLAGNAFVDSLAEELRIPDSATLEADISECTATDPLVRKLVVHRGSAVAHRSAKRVISPAPLSAELALSLEDVESLLGRARTVLNRYCQLFAAETFSVNMIGRSDFEFIFKAVAASVEHSRNAACG